MASIERVLIIGGGVAGPVLAIFLRKAGIDALVFEADPAPNQGGAGLSIATNGMRVLKAAGLPTADFCVLRDGDPSTRCAIPFPVFVKPRFGSASIGVQMATNMQQLHPRAGRALGSAKVGKRPARGALRRSIVFDHRRSAR